MKEQFIDELLNIKTAGEQIAFNKSFHYHRYEPTPYEAIEILFSKYVLKSSDRLVDFGCGRGRLNFYVNYLYDCSVVGVEMNEKLYQEAIENRNSYLTKMNTRKNKILFDCCLAEEYQIHPKDNRFYFFNPFSIQIFIKVVNNILRSFEENQREVELILYYSSEDYIYYLEHNTSFELKCEVPLKDYEHNSSEAFLIYQLSFVTC